MKEEKKDTVKEENARLAYMVAWRDRYIQKLEERVSGHEEANDILQALLFFALMKTGEPDEAGRITVREGFRNVVQSTAPAAVPTMIESNNALIEKTLTITIGTNAVKSTIAMLRGMRNK